MAQDVLTTRWKQFRKELNYQCAELSPDDLDGIDGSRDSLVLLMESRYGFVRRRAEREVERIIVEFEDRLARAS